VEGGKGREGEEEEGGEEGEGREREEGTGRGGEGGWGLGVDCEGGKVGVSPSRIELLPSLWSCSTQTLAGRRSSRGLQPAS
jgi:hypothetical protein